MTFLVIQNFLNVSNLAKQMSNYFKITLKNQANEYSKAFFWRLLLFLKRSALVRGLCSYGYRVSVLYMKWREVDESSCKIMNFHPLNNNIKTHKKRKLAWKSVSKHGCHVASYKLKVTKKITFIEFIRLLWFEVIWNWTYSEFSCRKSWKFYF